MLSYTHVSVVYTVYMFIFILYLLLYIYVFSVPLYMVIENKDDWLIDCLGNIFIIECPSVRCRTAIKQLLIKL